MKHINIQNWVDKAKSNPQLHSRRMLTEIILEAVSLTPHLHDGLYLKGGTLMSIGYESPRSTVDIDFTVITKDHEKFTDIFEKSLNGALRRSTAKLGYIDYICRVQKVEKKPKNRWPNGSKLSLKVTVGMVKRGTKQEQQLLEKRLPNVLSLDLSFFETVNEPDEIRLRKNDGAIQTYSIYDMVAEKCRALLQAPTRHGRSRRQDVYDINWILEQTNFTSDELSKVLDILKSKSQTHGIDVDRNSMQNPEVRKLAQVGWSSIEQEIGELPDFNETFDAVVKFYTSLPW
jgi:predicted nucleotidyltransferase component of viral defense system